MLGHLHPGISIHSDRMQLILPAELEELEIASIVERKPQILTTLRASQMNAAGFYTTLPGSLIRELQASPWVVLDIQTTATTRYSMPDRVSAETSVGPGTWMTYRAAHPGVSLNTRPRIRVLSVYTDDLGSCSWDLDALSPDDRQQLFDAAIDKKIVVGHNTGIALSWLFTETAARPACLLDIMLLMRQLRPLTLLRPFVLGLDEDNEVRTRVERLVKRESGSPTASLEWIGTALRLPTPDTNFQKHTSWCVTELSGQHREYFSASAALNLRILHFLLPGVDIREMPEALKVKYPWYAPFATSTIRLAESHARGVPFDAEAADLLRSECLTDIETAADRLILLPEFATLHRQLRNPQVRETAELKSALAQYTTANEISLPVPEEHPATSQSGRISGPDALPGWKLFQTIKINKAGYSTVGRYKNAASQDGRMHSLITFMAATGRNTSCEPTLQNVPRDPRFRALIKARPGHLILAADYAAIELRIAAVLAERAVLDLRQRIRSSDEADWFLGRVIAGGRASHTLRCPPEPPSWSLDWLNAAIPAVAQSVLRRNVQMMMSIFQRDLDPHMVTAIDMAARQGKIDCGVSPLEWLAGRDKHARDEMKLTLHEERRQAKPANFGLLYGIGNAGLHKSGIDSYGLSWTFEEAAQARQAWFELYPEFRLWHFWTKYQKSRHIPLGKCAIWNSRECMLVRPCHRPRLYETSTLSGRPIAILDNFRQALNYQSQGTGADILAVAIASLPDAISQMLLIPVHDELVFEVPAGEIDEVCKTVVEKMTWAAHEVLGGGIPVEAKPTIGETWQ